MAKESKSKKINDEIHAEEVARWSSDEIYIEELTVWIQQQQERFKSCEVSIEECDKQLKIIRNLKRLEKAQAALIRQRIRGSQKDLEKIRKSKGLK